MNNYVPIILELIIGVMACLLYSVEARVAKVQRAKAKSKAKKKTNTRNTCSYNLIVEDVVTEVVVGSPKMSREEEAMQKISEKMTKRPRVVKTMKKPLSMNQMVKLIEANADRLTKTHYYTLQVAYGLVDVPFEVNLKDSLQWICEQLGLTSTIEDESYLNLDYAFDNKQLVCNL